MDIALVILGLALLILGHEFGHFSVAKFLKMKVEEFGIGFPPRLFGKKKGETLYSVNALPFGGFVKIYGEGGEEEDDPAAFLNKPFVQKSLVVLAGIVMNLLIGWVMLAAVLIVGTPSHLMIVNVESNSPAAAAGLKTGDVIKKATVGGATLSDPIASSAFVKAVDDTANPAVSLIIDRNGEVVPVSLDKRANPPAGQGAIGIGLSDIGSPPEPFFQALGDAAVETFNFSLLIFGGLWTLISGIFTNPSVVQGVAGPVGIVVLASHATSIGIMYLIQLLGLISVNLAVLNLIPFPALDGGRFLMFIIEKIRRKKISMKVQLAVNGAGFALLILLMLFVTYNDVRNLIVH